LKLERIDGGGTAQAEDLLVFPVVSSFFEEKTAKEQQSEAFKKPVKRSFPNFFLIKEQQTLCISKFYMSSYFNYL
jgi:hypothetical protein